MSYRCDKCNERLWGGETCALCYPAESRIRSAESRVAELEAQLASLNESFQIVCARGLTEAERARELTLQMRKLTDERNRMEQYWREACQDNQGLAERLAEIDALVEAQAEDEGLWSVPAEGTQRIAEAYLQQELRRLHAVIEGTRQADKQAQVTPAEAVPVASNSGVNGGRERADPPVLTAQETYPCDKCGKLRTKAEGGTTFTVCDACWEATQDPFADFCTKCVHPKGWHRKNEAACIECGCLEFTARTSNDSQLSVCNSGDNPTERSENE